MSYSADNSHTIGICSSFPPLKDKLLLRSNNVDEMYALIGNVIRPHHFQPTEESPGAVNAEFHHAPLSQVSISYLVYGFDAEVEAERLGAYMIEIPLSGYSKTLCGGHSFNSRPGNTVIVNSDHFSVQNEARTAPSY